MKALRLKPPSSCSPKEPFRTLGGCCRVVYATEVVGFYDNRFKVKVRRPAPEGKANSALIALLASVLQLKPKQLSLQSGHKARLKGLRVEGLCALLLQERIDETLKKS